MNYYPIQLVIFDLDGVIVDTAKYHYLAWKRLAAGFDFELSRKKNEQLKGVSRVESLKLILQWAEKEASETEQKKMRTLKNKWYVEYIEELTPQAMLPGVFDFMLELKHNGIKIAIGSASKNTPLILERLEITGLFDAVVDGNMTTESKPHPEVFLKGAELCKTLPANTLVFEDAPKGIDAALAGDMLAVGVGDEKELGHAHFVIPGFEHFSYTHFIEQIKLLN